MKKNWQVIAGTAVLLTSLGVLASCAKPAPGTPVTENRVQIAIVGQRAGTTMYSAHDPKSGTCFALIYNASNGNVALTNAPAEFCR